MICLSERKQNEVSQKERAEMLDLWGNAVKYYNNVCNIVQYFPEDIHLGLDSQAKISALSISDCIAKGTNSKTKNEFHESFEKAVDSIYSTVSTLLIANKWKYLRTDLYHEVYQDGELLAKKIKRISLSTI